MKTETRSHDCVVGSSDTVRDAQIAATPQMFKVLSSQIYTNKELAIVRELCANAVDAHADAGKADVPFDIHMPSILEPWFEIVDYGTGLAPDDVMSLYMDYGMSNKTHTNELIGGFGLGSKAPFCYTDSFTVTSRYNGTAYTFTAFIKENGAPACVKLGEQTTNSPNGLTIYVPIENSAYATQGFEDALFQVYPNIPTRPNVTGVDSTMLKRMEIDADNMTNVSLPQSGLRKVHIRPQRSRNDPEIQVRMGIVSYAVHDADLSMELRRASDVFTSVWRKDYAMILDVDIGRYEITVSRESLSMTDATRTQLKADLLLAGQALDERFKKDIDTIDTWYQFAKAVSFARPSGLDVSSKSWSQFASTGTIPEDLRIDQVFEHYNVKRKGMYRKDMSLQARCRTNNMLTLSPRLVDEAMFFVTDKGNAPAKRFATQHFERNPSATESFICVVHGNADDLRAMFKALGIPNAVHEMPEVAPLKRNGASGVQQRNYGKFKYDFSTQFFGGLNDHPVLDGNGTFDNKFGDIRTASRTANELLDMLEYAANIDPASIVIAEGSPNTDNSPTQRRFLRLVDNAVGNNLITPAQPVAVWHVQIPAKHSRVREALYAQCKALGIKICDSAYQLDRLLLQPAIMDHPGSTQYFELNHKAIRQKALLAQYWRHILITIDHNCTQFGAETAIYSYQQINNALDIVAPHSVNADLERSRTDARYLHQRLRMAAKHRLPTNALPRALDLLLDEHPLASKLKERIEKRMSRINRTIRDNALLNAVLSYDSDDMRKMRVYGRASQTKLSDKNAAILKAIAPHIDEV